MSDPTISIDDKALAMLLAVRDREPDAGDLALVVAVSGVRGAEFTYELAYIRLDDARPDDHVVPGPLPVVIPAGHVDNLRGAVITVSRNLLEPGLVVDNPNSPSPRILGEGAAPELSGTVAERVEQTIAGAINPAIAAHGGYAEVVAVEDSTVYLRLGGGCQGCGMAAVTLSQGIEATVLRMVPEITRVVDVTDHAEGTNPYYEQSKK